MLDSSIARRRRKHTVNTPPWDLNFFLVKNSSENLQSFLDFSSENLLTFSQLSLHRDGNSSSDRSWNIQDSICGSTAPCSWTAQSLT